MEEPRPLEVKGLPKVGAEKELRVGSALCPCLRPALALAVLLSPALPGHLSVD